MYGDMDLGDRYDSALPPGSPWSRHPGVSRPGITPPRLHAIDPAATRPIPELTVADLRLPAEVVRERADDYAARARAQGTPHSMRLWRRCFEQAITMLAREASHLPADAVCEALFWQQKGREYWVSATFSARRALPMLH